MKVKCPKNLAGVAGHIGPIYFDESGISEEVSAERARSFLAVFGGELVSELPEGVATIDQAVVIERQVAVEQADQEYRERLKFRKDLSADEKDKVTRLVVAGDYTREALEALADEGGIKAIREVAVKLGVKGKAINELIEAILEAQASASPVAE